MNFVPGTYRSLVPALILLLVLLGARMCWHSSFHFAFLLWNIFLAILPLLFSHLAVNSKTRLSAWSCSLLWLLFLPNSAYLLTDIIHLRVRAGSSVWLDAVILFGAGLYGVVLGLKSLRQMEGWYSRFLSKRATLTLTIIVLLLNGYGIYLGRVERWNSWDIIFNTGDLLSTIAYQIRHPFRCIEVWALSSVFAAGLALGYFTLRTEPR